MATGMVMISSTVGDNADSRISKVDTWNFGQSANTTYQYESLTLGVNGTIDFRNSQSDRSNFRTINTMDFNYGFTGQYLSP